MTDQNGRAISLSDFQGRKLLLYFGPKAEMPGCTKQTENIRDSALQVLVEAN